MRARHLYLIALLVAGIDQASKHLVAGRMYYGDSIPLLGGLLHISLLKNSGGAFGLFQSWTGLLTFVTLAVVAAIIFLVRCRATMPAALALSLGLQLGGAVGNLIDRVRFGYVVDFIDFRIWPVFNVADIAITAGIFLLAWYLFMGEGSRSSDTIVPAAEIPQEAGD